METCAEVRSLGGHTGSVTDVIIMPYRKSSGLGRLSTNPE